MYYVKEKEYEIHEVNMNNYEIYFYKMYKIPTSNFEDYKQVQILSGIFLHGKIVKYNI